MKPIFEVYPRLENDGAPSDYRPLLESLGHEIVLQVDDDNYSGDSWLLLRATTGYIGYLQFGWGSCSGCDALQQADTYAALEALREDLKRGVLWFQGPGEALDWFLSHDWEGDYSSQSEERARFIREAKDWLTAT